MEVLTGRLLCFSYDAPSMDSRYPSYTETHPDWMETLNPASFREFGQEIFEAELAGGVTIARPRKKAITQVDIEIDEHGIPVWPKEDIEKDPWNLETKKDVIRKFMKAHQGEFQSSRHHCKH